MSMISTAGISDPAKMSKKQFHWKNDSGELDVFEAAKYFSDLNEVSGYNGANKLVQKMMRDERQPWRGGRMSLDMPAAIRESLPSHHHHHHHHHYHHQTHFREKQTTTKEKKYKQPSSPGGRLASFLNSLFSQTSSKKKKSKSVNAADSLKDEDESPGGRRRRRISISHFRLPSSNTHSDSNKSIYSSSASGFRTPPPYAYTPTKSYKDLYNDHHHQGVNSTLPKSNSNVKSTAENQVSADKKHQDYAWLDEKSRLSNAKNSAEKCKSSSIISSNRFPEKSRTSWADQYLSSEKEFRKFNNGVVDDYDDGAESDSSSDLFELPNFDLDYSSSGLPVYETTNVDSIKRSAPISSGTR